LSGVLPAATHRQIDAPSPRWWLLIAATEIH